MKYFFKFTVILIALSSQAFGFGYQDAVTNGTVLGGFSPYTVALGTVRAVGASEPASIFTNPAQVASHPFTAQLSGSSISWTERVIETDIDKTIRTLMTNSNGLAAVVCPVGDITIGAGIVKVGEFGYDGISLIYNDPDDPEIGIALLQSSGSQIEAMGSLSMVVAGPLSAGFSGGVRRAAAEYLFTFDSFHFLIPDSSCAWSLYNSEFAWHAGLALNGELFKSGISYSSETEYMEDIIAFGGSAYAEHLKKATVGFEAELTSPFDQNRFLGKLFLSMPFTKSLEALISVSFDDNRVANRAGFGFGMGFSGRVGQFTIGGGVLNRFRARQDSAFPEETSDRVDDSYTIINLGISYTIGDLL
ncbi:MAG: hypothetical protein C5S43_06110 [Candidatus Methanocomedens sp.]|nr:MAG: hypothetical protein C5S43_06110 [ANME-2 cluster archaeon]